MGGMKNWKIFGFLALLIFGFLLMSGCTSASPSTAPVAGNTPTPKIVYVTVTVTSTPTRVPTQIPNTKPDFPNIIVKGDWKGSGSTNPVPVSTHLEAVNIGRADGINVQADIAILYNQQVIKTQKIYFGTIKAGDTIAKDEVIMVTFPTNFNRNLIDMKVSNILIDGKEGEFYIPE